MSLQEHQNNTLLFLVFLLNDPCVSPLSSMWGDMKTNAWFSRFLCGRKQQISLYILHLVFSLWAFFQALSLLQQSENLCYGQTGVVSKFHCWSFCSDVALDLTYFHQTPKHVLCLESPNPEQIHLLAYCRYEATLYTHHLPSEPALYANVNAYFVLNIFAGLDMHMFFSIPFCISRSL